MAIVTEAQIEAQKQIIEDAIQELSNSAQNLYRKSDELFEIISANEISWITTNSQVVIGEEKGYAEQIATAFNSIGLIGSSLNCKVTQTKVQKRITSTKQI